MQVFTIYYDELKGRLDPQYLLSIEQINDIKTSFPIKKLGDLMQSAQYGANERAIPKRTNDDLRYIRITDIDEFGNLKNDEWKTAENIDKKYQLESEDLLFARSGATAGKTFFYKEGYEPAIFAGYLIRFKLSKKLVLPAYVFYYTQLSTYHEWVKSIQRPSGQPNINSEEFKSLLIPIPPLEIQKRISNIMDNAYYQKSQKEQEAQRILDSVEDFIFQELGVQNQEVQNKMCFTLFSNEIEGILSPHFYNSKPAKHESFIELSEVAEINPSRKKPSFNKDQIVPYVGLPETDDRTVKTVLLRPYKEVGGRNIIEEGDILFARIEPSVFNKKYIYADDCPVPVCLMSRNMPARIL